MRIHRFAATVLLCSASLGVAACSSSGDDGDAGGGLEIAVAGSDSACTPASKELASGKTTFVFTNSAKDVSELYVYEGSKVVGEVEDVLSGSSKNLTVTLAPGKTYKLTCKPGQKGDGFSTEVTVE